MSLSEYLNFEYVRYSAAELTCTIITQRKKISFDYKTCHIVRDVDSTDFLIILESLAVKCWFHIFLEGFEPMSAFTRQSLSPWQSHFEKVM